MKYKAGDRVIMNGRDSFPPINIGDKATIKMVNNLGYDAYVGARSYSIFIKDEHIACLDEPPSTYELGNLLQLKTNGGFIACKQGDIGKIKAITKGRQPWLYYLKMITGESRGDSLSFWEYEVESIPHKPKDNIPAITERIREQLATMRINVDLENTGQIGFATALLLRDWSIEIKKNLALIDKEYMNDL